MIEIYGQGRNWAPDKLIVENSESNSGKYNYLDRGGSGILYVNKDKNKVIKIIPNTLSANKEFHIHQLMGNLASTLYFNSPSEGLVVTDKDNKKYFFYGEKVYILIMEYLNPEEWNPINNIPQLVQYHYELFDFIYELIFTRGYKNVFDFVGMTGPHLFISDDEEIKILDFGEYKPVEDEKKDFLLMIKELQDSIMILYPTQEDLDCYEKIMNFDTSLEEIDDNCKKYLLYSGREFLEDRLSIERGRKRKKLSGKKKKKKKKRTKRKKTKGKNKRSSKKKRRTKKKKTKGKTKRSS